MKEFKNPEDISGNDFFINDALYMEEFNNFAYSCTQDVINKTRYICLKNGHYFISPTYFKMFELGMKKIKSYKPEAVFAKILLMDNPETYEVSSIGKTIIHQYGNKFEFFKKIRERRKTAPWIVPFNKELIEEAEKKYTDIISAYIYPLDNAVNHEKQMHILNDMMNALYGEILLLFEKASKPVFETGKYVMNIVNDILSGRFKDPILA